MYDEIRRIRKHNGSDGGRFGCAVGRKKIIINISRSLLCLFHVWLVAMSNLLLDSDYFSDETNAACVTRILEVQRSFV